MAHHVNIIVSKGGTERGRADIEDKEESGREYEIERESRLVKSDGL